MDAPTAYSAAKLGMWLFLATEILLFGGLFCAFAVYRWMYLDEFHHASRSLNWQLGMLNTAVLIFSSYTAALAVDAAQRNDNKRVTKLLFTTIVCGGIFLVVK
jgi:cytochrome c oxidase subunit 3